MLFDFIEENNNQIDWKRKSLDICKRKKGVGADGVLLLENDPKSDFKMRIFNPDGSEAEMCGNGARCSGYYFGLKTNKKNVEFNTVAGKMKSVISDDNKVKLSVPPPTSTQLDILLRIGSKELSVSHTNTGVPHSIVETDRLENIEIEKIGRNIRYHERFAPAGTNVDFVQVEDDSNLIIRTYERGVEKETFACGTGVIASAVIESLKGKVESPVKVRTKGGEVMTVYFEKNSQDDLISKIYNVKLEGEVHKVFDGVIDL